VATQPNPAAPVAVQTAAAAKPGAPAKPAAAAKPSAEAKAAAPLYVRFRLSRGGTDDLAVRETVLDAAGTAVGLIDWLCRGGRPLVRTDYAADGRAAAVAEWYYTAAGRLAGTVRRTAAAGEALAVAAESALVYDGAGRLVSVRRSAGPDWTERRLQWDEAGLLVGESWKDSAGAAGEWRHAYESGRGGVWTKRTTVRFVARFGALAPDGWFALERTLSAAAQNR
jgi:YD repeat-containing protein